MPTYIGTGFVAVIIGLLVAFVLAGLLVYILGFKEEATVATVNNTPAPTGNTSTATTASVIAKEVIISPLQGTILPLESLEDPAFSSGAMGKGIAIEPTSGLLTSPVNGTITTVFPTGHAIGITSNDGAEMLIHVGMNTVRLKGQFFEKMVKEGDVVEQGQLLLKFDIEQIRAAGYVLATPVIVTNAASYLDVLKTSETEVNNQDYLLTAVV